VSGITGTDEVLKAIFQLGTDSTWPLPNTGTAGQLSRQIRRSARLHVW